jgi:hypothetical protein
MFRRQRAIEIVPSSKPLPWRRYDVPQHLAPETSDALRFRAVDGDRLWKAASGDRSSEIGRVLEVVVLRVSDMARSE